MARDKLSKILWYKLLVNFFFGPTKFAPTTNIKIARGWGAKSLLLPVDKHTKPSGWGTTLSQTHDMPKKSRVAREKPDKLFAILAEHTRVCWAHAHLEEHPQELAGPQSCQSLFDYLRETVESNWRHGQDSLVESIHFFWFFYVQHQDPALHTWLSQAPQCATRALQPHWPPHWRSRVCVRSRARYYEGKAEYRGAKVPHLFHGHSYHKTSFARDSGYKQTLSKQPQVIHVQWEITKTEKLLYFD